MPYLMISQKKGCFTDKLSVNWLIQYQVDNNLAFFLINSYFIKSSIERRKNVKRDLWLNYK